MYAELSRGGLVGFFDTGKVVYSGGCGIWRRFLKYCRQKSEEPEGFVQCLGRCDIFSFASAD